MRDSFEYLNDEGGAPGRLRGGAYPLDHEHDQNRHLGRFRGGECCLERLLVEEDGLSTAEYAVGTVAVVGLGGLLIKLLTSDWFFGLLQGIFDRALTSVF